MRPFARGYWFVFLFVPLHLAIAQDSLGARYQLAKPFAGCYELRVPAWSETIAKQNDLLPTRFQLTLQFDLKNGKKGFVARNLDSRVHYFLMSSWNANSDGSLDLSWSTGFVEYRIRLAGPAAELRGTANYWTDTDPYPHDMGTNRNSVTVVAHRVVCQDSAN